METINEPPTSLSDAMLISSIDSVECQEGVTLSDADRTNIMLETLEHRRLLLERVIMCRQAAEYSLGQYTAWVTNEENTTSDTKNENEVEVFRDMCLRVMQSTTHKRMNSVNVPQRGSMSMRKSTLGRKVFNSGSGASESFIDDSQAASFTVMESANQNFTSLDNMPSLTHNVLDMDMTQSSNNVSFIDVSDTSPSNNGLKDSKLQKKNFSLNSKRPMQARTSRSVSIPNSLMDFGPGSTKSLDEHDTTMYSDPQHIKKPPVLLEQLRSQRQNIITQLESLAKKRRASLQGNHPCEESPDGVSRKPNKKKLISSAVSSPTSSSSSSTDPIQIRPPHQVQPPYFPSRVKTQWDYILEEMRWLATDFLEERKWKRIHARVRSEAIRLHFIDSYKAQSSPSITQVPVSSIMEQRSVALVTISSSDTLDIESNHTSMNDMGTWFRTPSEQEIDMVRDLARIQSIHVDRFWKAFRSQSEFVNSEEDFSNIHNPCMKIDASVTEQGMKRTPTVGDTAANSLSTQLTNELELKHDEITSKMNHILDHMKHILQRVKDIQESTYLDEISQCENSMKPYSTQLRALYHFEQAWSPHDEETRVKNSPGLILSGPHSCGKTVAISALLWKIKSSKPHLLLCPRISMFRWKYELEKFFESNILIFGQSSWFEFTSNLASSGGQFSRNNSIILCELAYYRRMIKDIEQNSRAETFSDMLSTIVVDTRCCFTDKFAPTSVLSLQNASFHKGSCSTLCQLRSYTWWNQLTADFKSSLANRVIIERDQHTSSCNSQDIEYDEKHRDELLSAKLAFLLNPIFHTIKGSPSKKLLSWAKRHVHKDSTSNDAHASSCILSGLSGSVKALGTRAVLSYLETAIIYHLHYPPIILQQGQFNLQNRRFEPRWSVRLCSCSRSQRSLYDKVFLYVRGALSTCNPSHNVDSEYAHRSYILASKALLWLRRVCFFSSDGRKDLFRKIVLRKFSTPNIEMADFMMERSAKLKELLVFLRETCGYSRSSFESLTKRQDSSNTKKILILASLPEVIFITSLFLNALGITNETVGASLDSQRSLEHSFMALFDPNCTIDDSPSDDIWDRQYCQTIRNQNTIRRFIDSSSNRCDNSSLDVLIGDPMCLGHHHFGLSASCADYVLVLDEDWSSRGRIAINDIQMKNYLFHQGGCHTQFIKFVLGDTCDEIFFSAQSNHDPTILSQIEGTPFINLSVLYFGAYAHIQLHTPLLNDTLNAEERQFPIIKAKIPFIDTENINTFLHVLGSVELASSPNQILQRNHYCSSSGLIHNDQDAAHKFVRTSPFLYSILNYLTRSIQATRISARRNPRVEKITAQANNFSSQQSDIDDFYESLDLQSLGTVIDLLTYSSGILPLNALDVDIRRGNDLSGRIKIYGEEVVSSRRKNLYSRLYKLASPHRDGKQGVDKLLYFPPLFPSLLEYNRIMAVNEDRDTINAQKSSNLYPQVIQSGKKRKAYQGNSSSKRMRSRDAEAFITSVESFPLFENFSDEILDSVDMGLLTGDDPVFDSESEIFDVDVTLSDLHSSSTKSVVDREDFGLIGKGELPPLSASINTALEQSVQTTGVSVFYDPYYSHSNTREEESIIIGTLSLPPHLESFIVYMKNQPKKPSSFLAGVLGRSNSMPATNRPSKLLNGAPLIAMETPLSQTSLSLTFSDCSEIQPKALKSKLSSKMILAGTEHPNPVGFPSGHGSNQCSSPNVNALQPYQSAAKSKRHDSYSSIIFSGGHKGQPYVNFRRHVINRLVERRFMDIDENSPWLQSVHPVPAREKIGDSAVRYSTSQSQSNKLLHQTMSFGPFSTGFVSSTLTNEINTKLPKVCGVELPMGVKVPHISTITDKAAWSEAEDERLRILAINLSENWNLIRIAITDRNEIGNDYHHYPFRSAYQCEEKWNIIMRENLSSQENTNINDLDGTDRNDGSRVSQNLLSKSFTTSRESNAKSVQILLKANLKRRRMQISLPGPNSHGASAIPQVVIPHPSHSQSVHDALGLIGGQMRSEIWPLQLLENIEKQVQSTNSSVSPSHLASPGVFHQQQNTNKKTSSTSPVTNHNTSSRSHLPGNGSRSPQNRTTNSSQPSSNASTHPQFSTYGPPPYRYGGYPAPDTS